MAQTAATEVCADDSKVVTIPAMKFGSSHSLSAMKARRARNRPSRNTLQESTGLGPRDSLVGSPKAAAMPAETSAQCSGYSADEGKSVGVTCCRDHLRVGAASHVRNSKISVALQLSCYELQKGHMQLYLIDMLSYLYRGSSECSNCSRTHGGAFIGGCSSSP